jgi:hypothetical protein
MLVDAREVLFGRAANSVRYATELLLAGDLSDVEEPTRSYWLRNRLELACGLLAEATRCIELGRTKV